MIFYKGIFCMAKGSENNNAKSNTTEASSLVKYYAVNNETVNLNSWPELKEKFVRGGGKVTEEVLEVKYRDVIDYVPAKGAVQARAQAFGPTIQSQKSILPNNSAEANLSIIKIDSLLSKPAEYTKKTSTENLINEDITVVLASIPSNPSHNKASQTPPLARKNPEFKFSKSSSSSSLFKQKQVEPIRHAPLYIGNDIYLKDDEFTKFLDNKDPKLLKEIRIKPATSFPGYVRIYSPSQDALIRLMVELHKESVGYKVLGSKANTSNTAIFSNPKR